MDRLVAQAPAKFVREFLRRAVPFFWQFFEALQAESFPDRAAHWDSAGAAKLVPR
jgi:hypothetical protein